MKARLSILLLAALALALTGCADSLFTSNLFKEIARPAVPDSTAISQMSETDIAKLLNSATFLTVLKDDPTAEQAFKDRLVAIGSASEDPAVDQTVSYLLADLTLEESGAAPVVENLLSTFIGLMSEPKEGETVDPTIAEAKKFLDSTERSTMTQEEMRNSASALVSLIFTPESGGAPTLASVTAALTGFAEAKAYYEDFGLALKQNTTTGEYYPEDATLDMGTLATGALVSYLIDAVTISSSTAVLTPEEKIIALASMIIDPSTPPANVASVDFDTASLDSEALLRIASASGLSSMIDGLQE